jgi:hypothetical protein
MASEGIFHTCNITLHEFCYQTLLMQKYTLFTVFLSICYMYFFLVMEVIFRNGTLTQKTVNRLVTGYVARAGLSLHSCSHSGSGAHPVLSKTH